MRVMLHLFESGNDVFDEEGVEVESLDAARNLAITAAREILAHEMMMTGKSTLNRRIEIADESGTILASVSFASIMPLGNG